MLVTPVWDYQLKTMRIDVITPDNITVETKDNYLIFDKMKIKKARPDGTYIILYGLKTNIIIDGESKLPPVKQSRR